MLLVVRFVVVADRDLAKRTVLGIKKVEGRFSARQSWVRGRLGRSESLGSEAVMPVCWCWKLKPVIDG